MNDKQYHCDGCDATGRVCVVIQRKCHLNCPANLSSPIDMESKGPAPGMVWARCSVVSKLRLWSFLRLVDGDGKFIRINHA